MRRAVFVTMVVLACVALAQSRPDKKSAPALGPTAADAGVVSAKADAGVSEARAPAPATAVELERAKKELAELRVKVTELEGRVSKAETLSRDVESLRMKAEKLEARLDAEDERRASEEREAQRKKAVAAQNQQMLSGALQQLATGNTANVDVWLRTAEANSTGNAQKLVQLARAALAQQDLVATRQYLILALME